MLLVDSHCHIQSERFDDDRAAVLLAAREAGVVRMLVPGWDEASSWAALELVTHEPWLDAAAGIHPHEAGRADASAWEAVARLAADHRTVAVGETGLDYDRLFSPVEAQRTNLRRHLELGLALDKPVIIHCRSAVGETQAHDDLLDLLADAGITASERARREAPAAIIHSFSGSAAFADEVRARGLAISISGLAFRTGEGPTFEAVARRVPPERLLTETDSPFLSPPGAPRRRNEPAWVRVTAERLAGVREVAPDSLGSALVEAYDRTFRIPAGRPRTPPAAPG